MKLGRGVIDMAGMWMRSGRVVKQVVCGLVACGAALLLGAEMGAGPVGKAGGAGTPVKRDPWFEARTICLFRLGSGPMPQTAVELSEALQRGWAQAIRFRDPSSVVTMEQPDFPTFGALKLNLTDGHVKIARQ